MFFFAVYNDREYQIGRPDNLLASYWISGQPDTEVDIRLNTGCPAEYPI